MASINKYDYIAIIGDIVDSRDIANRKEVQEHLKKVLADVNIKYRESINSKFMITLGDEFQGLVNSNSRIMNIISDIELEMYPTKIRFGVGLGKISTEILLDKSNEIDGPAYHRARSMIIKQEAKKGKQVEYSSSIMIDLGQQNYTVNQLINATLLLVSKFKEQWTKRQVEVIQTYTKLDKNQIEVAEQLKIRQSSVSSSLKSANYYAIELAYKTVQDAINSIGDSQDD